MKTLENCCLNINQLISERTSEEVTEIWMKEIVESYDFSKMNWKEYSKQPFDKPYGRNLIFKSDRLEVILMTWAVNHECDVHDHGDALGVVKILDGRVINTIFKANEKNRMPEKKEIVAITGNVIIEVPHGMLHTMKNAREEYSYTLHFYTPPITGMKVYDLDQKNIVTVADNCGAWLSEPALQLKIDKI